MTVAAAGLAIAATLSLAGCNSGSGGTLPFSPPKSVTFHHLYAADVFSSEVIVYALPLTSTSTPAYHIDTTALPTGVCFSAKGDMFVVDNQDKVEYFKAPFGPGSVPTATFAIGGVSAQDCKVDKSGTLWVPDNGVSKIFAFNAPFTSATAASFALTQGVDEPYGIAFDPSGYLCASNVGAMAWFSPPFSSGSVGKTFGTNYSNEGVAFDKTGDLFVSNGSAEGTIDVYQAPVNTNATISDFSFSAGNKGWAYYMAFDSSGNLYVDTNGTSTGISVFAPPFSSLSAPVVKTPYSDYIVGIALGP